MVKKLTTIDLSGKQYAQVSTRLKEFREGNPHGSIETKPTMMEDGVIMFTTTIIKDLSDPHSARATGSALGKSSGQKAFEKLETISVGRALALLGYAASGEIASSEEMDEFNAFKQEKVEVAIENLQQATNLEDLKNRFKGLGNLMSDPAVVAVKDEMKVKLTLAVAPTAPVKPTVKKRVAKAKVEDDGSVPPQLLPEELK